MPEASLQRPIMAESPDISHIITEDDTPVDNMFSEKQQRLLAESLNSSWKPGRPFVAASNVGVFYAIHEPPLVPDMFLSLDVQVAENLWEKKNRSYFIWEFGKPPDVVVEIVSNTQGRESDMKLRKYAHMRAWYYIIFDPQLLIQKDLLRIYELSQGQYIPKIDRQLTHIGLGVTLWEGVFEGAFDLWLRWCDSEGNLILTGYERAEKEWKRGEKEHKRAKKTEKELVIERQKAEQQKQRADRLAAKLKEMGISIDDYL